jgi:hypothetical protein
MQPAVSKRADRIDASAGDTQSMGSREEDES